jgi:MYXO-CTERM domain-containing protein
MTFALNPNSTETEAEFQAAAQAESSALSAASKNKSSEGGTSKGVKIGVSLGVIAFALLVAAALGLFFVRRRRQAQSRPPGYATAAELDLYAGDRKDSDDAEVKPPVPSKNYELATTRANPPMPRHELASLPAELAGSRFSEHVVSPKDETTQPHQGSFYLD